MLVEIVLTAGLTLRNWRDAGWHSTEIASGFVRGSYVSDGVTTVGLYNPWEDRLEVLELCGEVSVGQGYTAVLYSGKKRRRGCFDVEKVVTAGGVE